MPDDTPTPQDVEALAKVFDFGRPRAASTLRALQSALAAAETERDEAVNAAWRNGIDRDRARARVARLEANIEGLIREAVGMADGSDEEAFIERRLRAALREGESNNG